MLEVEVKIHALSIGNYKPNAKLVIPEKNTLS